MQYMFVQFITQCRSRLHKQRLHATQDMMDLSQMSSTIQHQNRRRIYSHICSFTHVFFLPAVTVDERYLSLASNPSSPLGVANKYGSCCSMRCAYTAGCRSIGADTLTC